MNRTKKFIKNFIFSAFAQAVTMICGFIVPKIMLNYYGSEVNGLVTSITQIMTYIALIEGGLSGASIFALYKPIADKDTGEISSVVSASRKMYMKAGYIGLTVTILVALCYPFIIKTNLLSYWEIVALFVIIAATTIFDFFILAKYRALLSAHQKEYIISISSTIQIITNAFCVFLFSYLGFNIVLVRLFSLLSLFFRVIIIFVYCKIKYRYIDFNAEPKYEALNKRWDALTIQILSAVHRGVPILIATVMLSLNDVSIYSVYNLVLAGIASILAIFMNGLQASFGDVIARKQWDTLRISFDQFELMYLFLITVLYSITFATIMPFVKIYVGDTDINYIYPVIGVLFTINGFLYSLKNPQGMLVISGGLYRETRWRALTQAAICIIVSVVACYFWGIPGILVGRMASNIYRDTDLLFFVPKTYQVIKRKNTLLKWMLFFTLFILMSIISLFIPYDWINGYLDWILYAMAFGVVTVIIVFVVSFIFYKEKYIAIIKRFLKLLNRNKKVGTC